MKRLAVVAVLLAVAGAGYAGVMIAGRGQDEDPALSRTPTPAASQLPGGGETTGTPRGGGRGGGAGGGATPSITPTPSVTGTPSPS